MTRDMLRGETAVVVAELPAFDGDEHGVPLQTVVTVEEVCEIRGSKVYRCSFYNNGAATNFFYPDELAEY